MQDFATALALTFVIEGILYAAFPQGMQRMVAQMGTMPPAVLRATGLLTASAGVAVVWLIRR